MNLQPTRRKRVENTVGCPSVFLAEIKQLGVCCMLFNSDEALFRFPKTIFANNKLMSVVKVLQSNNLLMMLVCAVFIQSHPTKEK